MPPTLATEQRGARALPPDTAVVIGAFDGLHRGHQTLLERARALAPNVALVTFDPHPTRVLRPASAPALLQTPTQRLRVAGHLGVGHVVLLPFDRTTAATSPADFVTQSIRDGLAPAAVVVGSDFRFGHRRAGTPSMLAELLPELTVEIVEPLGMPTGALAPGAAPPDKLGSTAIRQAVARGDVQRARVMLDRHYAVAGRVVQGDRRGRTIGFPTANVEVDNELLPPPGVYATVVAVWSPEAPDFGAVWPAVTNLGSNPTFTSGSAALRLESHVLDGDLGERLYGLQLEVSFVARLRDEQRFDGIDALVAQIARDADQARTVVDPAALAATVPPMDRKRPAPETQRP